MADSEVVSSALPVDVDAAAREDATAPDRATLRHDILAMARVTSDMRR